MNNAIVLISGGLDSSVLAYYLKILKGINKLKLIFLDYNQRALKEELFCVKKISEELNVDLKIINVKWLGEISTSLINKSEDIENIKEKEEIINWYVPCRNALFSLIALSIAESEFISKKEKYDVYIGIKYEGELRFKDTTPEFIRNINKTAKFCTEKGDIQIIAPFLEKDKEELIEFSKELGVNLQTTYSCYIGSGFKEENNKKIPIHCGVCSACKARKKAFKFSDTEDLSVYKN